MLSPVGEPGMMLCSEPWAERLNAGFEIRPSERGEVPIPTGLNSECES